MKFTSNIKTFFYGFCLGLSLLPPGFSTATMAIILGIYEALINLLSDLFSSKVKSTLKTILLLGIGALTAIFLFSQVISSAMNSFSLQTISFFLGMIIATAPLLYKQADVKSNFKGKHFVVTLLAFSITLIFIFYQNLSLIDLSGEISFGKIIFLILVGMLVSSSMILPGLSGALILMLLGVYHFLMDSISTLNVVVLGNVMLGGVLGLFLCGRLIKYLIAKHENTMNAISIGLVLGSIPVVVVREILNADVSLDAIGIITSLLLGGLGFVLVHALSSKLTSGEGN